jgi:hypothetical protein
MPWYLSRPSFYATVYLYNKSPIYGYITRSIKIHRQVLHHLLTFHQRTLIHLSSVSVTASIPFDLKKKEPKFGNFKDQTLSFQHSRVQTDTDEMIKFKKRILFAKQ